MSLLFGTPRPGDWICTTRPVRTGLTDHLIGGDAGVRPGTRGVITRELGWNRYEARLDTGVLGPTTVRVRGGQVRVVRRGGGVDGFAARTGRLNAARAGVAAVMIGPLIYLAAAWFLGGGTLDGFAVALVEGAVTSCLDLLAYALSRPGHALAYVLIGTLAWRFAFR